jgi:hypothetical protein
MLNIQNFAEYGIMFFVIVLVYTCKKIYMGNKNQVALTLMIFSSLDQSDQYIIVYTISVLNWSFSRVPER